MPVFAHTPPMGSRRSTTATVAPTLAAWIAAFWPAGPEPSTTRSKRLPSIGAMLLDRWHCVGVVRELVHGVGGLEQRPLGERPRHQL